MIYRLDKFVSESRGVTRTEAKKLLATMPLDYMEKGETDTDDEQTDIERYL